MERSRAGAEWVREPSDTNCTPVPASSLSVCGVMPPDASSSRPPADQRAASRSCVRRPCCRAAGGRRRPPAPPRTSASEPHSTSTGDAGGPPLERPAGRLPHPARERDVVVLHEDRVVEAHAVVAAAAGRDRLLLERAQARASSCACRAPRRRSRAARRPHAPWRSRCPTGAARKLSADALAGEQRAGVALELQRPSPAAPPATRPRAAARSIDDLRVEPPEDRLGHLEPEHHPRLLLRRSAPARACRARRPPRS